MVQGDSWTTIESDPGVFTELIKQIGVKGVQLEELYATDKESLELLKPVHGLIFLFKWVAGEDARPTDPNTTGRVFFAQQVISNACATQAILSVLLNCPAVDLGSDLTQFKQFTADFPPDMKGLAISNSDCIRTAHNSFARPEPLVPDEDKAAGKDDDAFHFLSYVPVDGTLWELDGLKQGPIALCSVSQEQDDWLDKVGPHIQARMERYAASEIRFNLMAVIGDRAEALSERLAKQQEEYATLQQRLAGGLHTDTSAPMEVEAGSAALAVDADILTSQLMQLDMEIHSTQEALASETARRDRWRAENASRKHNWLPLVFNLLKELAAGGKLKPIIEQARKASQ